MAGRPKGYKVKEETKKKISAAHLGKKLSDHHRKQLSLAKKGKRRHPLSEATKKKISLFHLGNKYRLGHKPTIETRIKMSQSAKLRDRGYQSRESHWAWIKDRSKLKRFNNTSKDRRSYAYTEWRKRVWLRDNFKCKIGYNCNGRIEVHHILSYTNYPELRYEINNGITLCHAHHPRKRVEEEKLIPVFQELVRKD